MRPLHKVGLASLFASVGLAALGPPSDAGAAGADPAARGLDLFLDAPGAAAPGGKVPLQIQAFGFPTVVALAPLAGASIEAVWDPGSFGKGVSSVPPPVTGTTDAHGRLHLDVPMPEGDARPLKLLVGTTIGDHHRTTEITVTRLAARELSLIVPDQRVVPGGATSAWAFLKDTSTGLPASGEEIVFELLEGGVARTTVKATTDAAGTAMARVPIPWTDDPTFAWKLSARSRSAGGVETGGESIALKPREETPGKPELVAKWAEDHAFPGDVVPFVLRLRDASDRPVVGAKIRYWIGPHGTEPPSHKEEPKAWERASTEVVTDLAGEARGKSDAPKTIRKGGSTSLRIVARGELFGHELAAERTVEVSWPFASVKATPETGALVPGIEQSLLIRVRDPRDLPVSAAFTVEADGLAQRVTTDARGEAEVIWKVPIDVGATRNVGPCAGGVAATVRVRPAAPIPALENRTDPFATCVTVNRDVAGIARAERPVTTAGGALRVSIAEAPDPKAKDAKKGAKKEKPQDAAWSVRAQPDWMGGPRSVASWVEDVSKGADLALPSSAPGNWSITAIAPAADRKARIAPGRVIVAPKVVPKLSAKMAGGRAAPLGTVEIDVDLTDGKGRGAPGSVAALLVDANGGGLTSGLLQLDTRRSQCAELGVETEACDAFFDDPAAETLRKRVLGAQASDVFQPISDPGGTAQEDMRDTFKRVLLSLEGAVMDATAEPELLRDAFRKEASRYTFNPELFTLVTAAMSPEPETPGGEPFALADLVAVDKQVTYDNVARRVTRLKLFRVLQAVRMHRKNRALDPDEPILRDPNAILRRMVSSNEILPSALLDPWGGTMSFVKAGAGERLPFVTMRGFELHAPGPDGKLGTADDVKSPFERVVASGTPYAKALDEDRLVDAALDMEVADATVDGWQGVLEELTGQTLGDSFGAGGIGLGSAGGGIGHGMGLGGVGTVGRRSRGIATGAAFWSPPQRTDDKGHLRIRVPLGDVETTWRLALVGAPDGATPAVTTIDIPSALPLSARVDAGAAWIAGDQADVLVTVRNRTQAAARVDLAFTASGVAELGSAKTKAVDVPAGGAVEVPVRVKSKGAGTAALDVVATGPSGLSDHTTHEWEVRAAGDRMELMSTQWVADQGTIALAQVGPGLQAIGAAKLTLERGNAAAIEAALEALEPDRILSMDALSYAEEAAARIQKWATARRGAGDPLATKAGDLVRRSIGRLLAIKQQRTAAGALISGSRWTAERRAVRWAPPDLVADVGKIDDCPPEKITDIEQGLAILEAEPSSADGVIQACWDNAVSTIVEKVTESRNRYALARALVALAERPQRAVIAASLAEKLRWWVELQPSGAVTLPDAVSRDRKARSTVFAALLRTASLGKKPAAASPDRIAAWLRVQRDARGSYGSTLATLSAVRALLQQAAEPTAASKVKIVAEGVEREVEVRDDQTVVIPLGAKALRADLTVTGPGVVARLSRPGLRLWSFPTDSTWSGIALDVQWPEQAKVGVTHNLHVVAATTLGRAIWTDVRIPLPPGAMLAEGDGPARQIQGQLVMRMHLDEYGTSSVLDLPVRFGLTGTFTLPEARARSVDEEGLVTTTAARPLSIRR